MVRKAWMQVGLGLLAGTVAALVVGRWNMARVQSAEERFRRSLEADLAERDTRNAVSVAFNSAAAGTPKPEAPAPVAPSEQKPAPIDPTKIPSAEESWREAHGSVDKHHADPVDAAWAERVTPALQHDIERAMGLGKLTGTLSNLECRSTSCLGTIRWPSVGDARHEAMQLMTAGLRVNCARAVMIPPDAIEGSPVDAEVIYDCAGWKAEGSNIAPI